MTQIVVAIDGSEHSHQALAWARELAQSSSSPMFHLVHAYQPAIPVTASVHSVGPALDSARHKAQGLLASIRDGFTDLSTEAYMIQDAPARAVLSVASKVGADLVAVGRRGLAPTAGMLLGSVSSEILHHTKSPVLVVHDAPPRTIGSVLVCVDDSPHSARALAFAHHWLPQASITVLHVTPVNTDSAGLSRSVAQRTAERAGVPTERFSVIGRVGNPVESVALEYRSGPYDLAVVGSRGLGTLGELFLGSVSERLSRLARGAVVIVK